jgi:uncharacterized protein involved in exopolysaccharide biosynthesis
MSEIIDGIKEAVKRRWVLLVVPPILFLGLSIAAIYFLTPTYKSSTTILVQQDEASKSVVFDVNSRGRKPKKPVAQTALTNFVKSRTTLNKLIDQVSLDDEFPDGKSKKKMVEALRLRIKTTPLAPDALELSFTDPDPERAQKAVKFLSNSYINNKHKLDKVRAKVVVDYYSNRLSSLQKKIDQLQNGIVSSNSSNIKSSPVGSNYLQSKLKNVNGQIANLEQKINLGKENQRKLQKFKDTQENNFSVQPLYQLPLQQIPQGGVLSQLLQQYDQMQQNYTDKYPPLQSLKRKIERRVDRITEAIKSNEKQLAQQKNDLLSQRRNVSGNIESSYVTEQKNSTQESELDAYKNLYHKLERSKNQARLNSDINNKTDRKVMVVDAASLPSTPSSPQKNIIMTVGVVFGFLAGCVMIVIAEVLDTTIHSEKDLMLDKPVIAYLSDGTNKK